uniref:Y4yA n=1 Tax=Rhizobium fredii TaxID=380 RepID=Q9EUG5_RHIFR|nr:Y4yA [Sinorhizobium fredii]
MTKIGHGLPPILRSATADLLTKYGPLLFDWAARHGSPLNLVWPDALRENLAALKGVLTERRVQHAIYYGAKGNKSPGLMQAALSASAGLDVSSLYELRDARRLGADGARLVATGPAKTNAFHQALINCNALISVDSPEELEDLIHGLPADAGQQPILLRLRPRDQSKSRFGMPPDAIVHCLVRLAGEGRLRFDGLHFHLSGYRRETRVAALSEAADLIAEARRMGFFPGMIDIGGGLPIQYVDRARYDAHLAAQAPEDYRTGKIPDSFYPYGSTLSAADWLHRLLEAEMNQGRSVAGYLAREGLTLAMEPGRALADQAAITVFRISRVKAVGPDSHVIFVSFSACETWFASEFLIDPILVPATKATVQSPPVRAYLAGHSCLDEDVISNRWLTFPTAPRAGDLLDTPTPAATRWTSSKTSSIAIPCPLASASSKTPKGGPISFPDTIGEV